MENDFAWDYDRTTFDSERGANADSAESLSTSDQNSSADDSLRNQTQPTPGNRFVFGHGLGRCFGEDPAEVLKNL